MVFIFFLFEEKKKEPFRLIKPVLNLATDLFSADSSLRASSPGRSGGGTGKERRGLSLQQRFENLNICIEKVDTKCCLAEITLLMTSLLLERVFRCLFTFALVSASRCSAVI